MVGAKPQEIAPGSKPLGSLKGKKYILSSSDEEFINEGSENLESSPSWKTPTPVTTPPPKPQTWSVVEEPKPIKQNEKWKGSRRWVGQRPHELAPMVMDANLFNQRNERSKAQRAALQIEREAFESSEVLAEKPKDESEEEKPLNMSLFLSSRPYYSHNVLRLKDAKDGAWVMENTIGASLSVKPLEIGDYVTMVPRLDMMMQIAAYQDNNVGGTSLKETLGYRFGLVKMGMGIELPKDYSVSLGYEYNLISSLDTGNKMSDAYTPSLRFGKMYSLNESTLLSLMLPVVYHRPIQLNRWQLCHPMMEITFRSDGTVL